MVERFVWTANLGTGDTCSERELTVPGEKSAYQKLLDMLQQKATQLTGFRLQKAGVTHNAPSQSPKAKFPSTVPVSLDYRRRALQKWMTNYDEKTGQYVFVPNNTGGYSLAGNSTENEIFCRYIVRAQGLKISLWVKDDTGDTWMQIEKEDV